MNSNPKCDFWLWNNAYNWNNNCNNIDMIAIIVTVWAHSTAIAAPPMIHKLVFTHRMGVHLNAVHRTYLQGLQSCSAKTNNAYNRNNNAYNSTGTLHQAAFHSVCPLWQHIWNPTHLDRIGQNGTYVSEHGTDMYIDVHELTYRHEHVCTWYVHVHIFM